MIKTEQSALEYFGNDTLATQVWEEKYALSGENTPEDMHKRLAKELHRIELKYPNPLKYEEIFELLDRFRYFIPAGSSMFGIGNNESISSLGNCFVIGNLFDSYGGILKSDEELVQIMKRRGGVGLDLSHLRSEGTSVSNAAKTSSGVISFMERYSNSTREVAQGGRRGALMLTLDADHPDAIKFATSKTDLTKITGANISLKIRDEFMRNLDKNKDLWETIIHQAWKSAEPGVLFWDRIKEESPADSYVGFETISTNPCGELPICPYDSCRLGSINLYSFVKNPFTNKASFSFYKFTDVVRKSQKLMDDIIDLEEEKINSIISKIDNDPEPILVKYVERTLWVNILDKLKKGRRTGLGILGLADCLAALGYKYSTREATNFSVRIVRNLAKESYKSSIDMANDRGAFPVYNVKLDFNSKFTDRMYDTLNREYQDKWLYVGRRNIANLSIAPTGSLSILTQTTSGIEPVFQLTYNRRRKLSKDDPRTTFIDDNGDCWEEYEVLHPGYNYWLSLGLTGNPYITSDKVDYNEKIVMQGRIQKWIDHSISVTHNLPKEITESDIAELYYKAWKYGCKGITIYRETSRDGVLLKRKESPSFNTTEGTKRQRELKCELFTPSIRGISYVVLVGLYDNKPYEVFCFEQNGITTPSNFLTGYIKKESKGIYSLLDETREVVLEDITSKFETPTEEFATRIISTALRHGTNIKYIVEQLNKSKGELHSFNKVIARVLKKYIKDGDEVSGQQCPQCGSTSLRYQDGCATCTICGYSRC